MRQWYLRSKYCLCVLHSLRREYLRLERRLRVLHCLRHRHDRGGGKHELHDGSDDDLRRWTVRLERELRHVRSGIVQHHDDCDFLHGLPGGESKRAYWVLVPNFLP